MFMCDITKTPPYVRYFVYGVSSKIVIVQWFEKVGLMISGIGQCGGLVVDLRDI